jgi:adenosylcobinamide-phosphate synthase
MPSASLAIAALAGVLLDRWFGEPRRWHPLVGFGRVTERAEAVLRAGAPGHPVGNRLRGLAAWTLIVVPFVALAAWFRHPVLDALLLWFALGGRSLGEHARAVAAPLAAGDLAMARERVGMIVSRDTTQLDEAGVATAAVESVLENGNDAVFGALFWFFVAGGAGVLLFRLANTLDAMWGYKDARRVYFGWAAARIDDALNYVPARLTALTYALFGATHAALACWRTQASAWESPNAGPVMAAGAGALKVGVGGTAVYHGREEVRPSLGIGVAPCAADIARAVALVERGQWLWIALFLAWSATLA